MTFANHRSAYGRFLVACILGLALAQDAVRAAEVPQPSAPADQLKTKAIEALRAGKFDLTNDYLAQAAAIAKDPLTSKMADWARQFEEQRKVFVGERRKEYEQAAADSRLLIEQKHDDFAIEMAAKSYLLVEDKDAFRKLPWVEQLLANVKKLAADDERKEEWLRSLRIYSLLSTIEPEVAQWKESLKTSTRRVRLLALYTPDELKRIQDADAKERDHVEAMLHPTTKPTTKPAVDEAENANRLKWEDALRGIKMDTLREGMITSHANYFRKVTFQKMMVGGLQSLRIVATTPALRQAFKGLADLEKRSQFLGAMDAMIAKVQNDDAGDESDQAMKDLLAEVQKTNSRTIDLPEAVLANEFADGAFGELDQFSSIIWPYDWDEFQKTTKGEFSGVGIQIQVDDAGNLKVVSPIEDSPAYRAGVKPDWIISHIDGKSARWINVNQAVKLITGPAGTDVVLTIKDTKGNSRDYKLRREVIKVPSVKGWMHRPGSGGWDYFIDPDQKIGYLRLTTFSKTSTQDMNEALDEMNKKDVRGIIFDLRYNPGGLLTEATNVVDKFIRDGLIVSTRPDRPEWASHATIALAHLRPNQKNNTPLVVLVNQYSASASEIVSGALKDHHRAFIVGERTYGKGSVQMLYPLGDRLGADPEAVLKLTTSHYYLPSGKCIHREEDSKDWGVSPDLTVEMTPDQMRAAIDARLQWDILRDAGPNEPGMTPAADAGAAEKSSKDPLTSDPQLAAALLVMRLQLAGGSDIVTANAAK